MSKRKGKSTRYDVRRENAQPVYVTDEADFTVARSLGWYASAFISVTGGVKVSLGSVLIALGVSDATVRLVTREIEAAFENELTYPTTPTRGSDD